MLFNTAQFGLFLIAVLLLLRLWPGLRWRNGVLLAASLLFYSLWTPAYLLLLLGELLVNYALLRAICASRWPRLALAASVVFTLGLLGFFKYAALAVETALPLLSMLGWNPPVPDIFLPLGISFFSFQIIALAVDSYRQPEQPPPSPARYALFISFFPQLIAGPILRGPELLPQLARRSRPSTAQVRRGFWLLAAGLAKKTILADFLLSPFVDDVFGRPGVGNAAFHWVALYGFAFQIYFDFSGYTDMARGMGCLLGFDLPLNFREPYLSRNPAEFWRRWHMTLSRWLRDYVYIPLGGNRRGPGRTQLNLLLTMLLGGLWHGAGWSFAIWGGLHGLLLVLHRRFSRRTRNEDAPLGRGDLLRVLLCFQAVCLLWIFFRAATLADALSFARALFTPSPLSGWPVLQTLVVLLCAALHVAERRLRLALPSIHTCIASRAWGAALEALALGGVLGVAIACSGAGGEFIYFQF
jgi:alginate O-acetyltransferase complex protein AlgI